MRPLTDEDGEVRELTSTDFRQMKPVREAMPELIEAVAEFRKKVGRPKIAEPKVHIGFRLAPDVVDSIKATGPGYNARVEQVLREAFVVRSAVDGKVISKRKEIVLLHTIPAPRTPDVGVTTWTDKATAKGVRKKPDAKPKRRA